MFYQTFHLEMKSPTSLISGKNHTTTQTLAVSSYVQPFLPVLILFILATLSSGAEPVVFTLGQAHAGEGSFLYAFTCSSEKLHGLKLHSSCASSLTLYCLKNLSRCICWTMRFTLSKNLERSEERKDHTFSTLCSQMEQYLRWVQIGM